MGCIGSLEVVFNASLGVIPALEFPGQKAVPFLVFYKDFIYLFSGRVKGKEKDRVKHQCVVAFHVPPTGNLADDPGMCSDWE